MLQTLLAERFKLVLRKETKTMPVYFLTVGKGGSRFNGLASGINSSTVIFFQDGRKVGPEEVKGAYNMTMRRDPAGKNFVLFSAFNLTMADFSKSLISDARRVVLDRTGLTGEYTFNLETGIDPNGLVVPGGMDNLASRPKMLDAIEEIGLKLEPATAPVEVWTVDHAERPSDS
jgi:uncharacterized protein (TIGR03435 family)